MKKGFVFMLAILGCAQAMIAQPRALTLYGAITNTFYLYEGTHKETRGFKVVCTNGQFFFDVTNELHTTIFHGETAADGYRHWMEVPMARRREPGLPARLPSRESRPAPKDDGSWINCLWLAFGSHQYFTNRSDLSALSIWPTGVNPWDETNMGIKAIYVPLEKSCFPAEVFYLSTGYDYFLGHTAGLLQKAALLPPLNLGYTNFAHRALAATNVFGLAVPYEVAIRRFAPKRSPPGERATLETIMECDIRVHMLSVDSRGSKLFKLP